MEIDQDLSIHPAPGVSGRLDNDRDPAIRTYARKIEEIDHSECFCDGECRKALPGVWPNNIKPICLGTTILEVYFHKPILSAWDPYSNASPEILVTLLTTYGTKSSIRNRFLRGSSEYWGGVTCEYNNKAEVCGAITRLSMEHPEYRGLSMETVVRTLAEVEPMVRSTQNTRILIKCTGNLRSAVNGRLLNLEDTLRELGAAFSFPLSREEKDPHLRGLEYQAIFEHFTHAFCADLYLDGRRVFKIKLNVLVETTPKTRAIMQLLSQRVRHHFQSNPVAPNGPIHHPYEDPLILQLRRASNEFNLMEVDG